MDINALDNFLNDASDQAAAWYSIATGKQVAVPSATIALQQNLADVPLTPAATGSIQTPFGNFSGAPLSLADGNMTPLLIAAAVIVVYLLVRR